MRALSGRSWGCSACDQELIYTAYVRPVADYCGGAYLPVAKDTTVEKLDVVQRQAARIITGCTRSTPSKALEREARLMPMRWRSDYLASVSLEKALRRKPGDALREVATANVRRGKLTVEREWRRPAERVLSAAGLDNVRRDSALIIPDVQPWRGSDDRIDFRDGLATAVKRTDPIQVKQAAAMETISKLSAPDISLYTDGSAKEATMNGGGGIYIEYADGSHPTLTSIPTGKICSSYVAEMHAISNALDIIHHEGGKRIHLFTDSKSTIQRLQMGPHAEEDQLSDQIVGNWNIWPAEATRSPCNGFPVILTLPETTSPISSHTVARKWANRTSLSRSHPQRPKRHTMNQWLRSPDHPWHQEACDGKLPSRPEEAGCNRDESVTIRQLRCGHSRLLRDYQVKMNTTMDSTCRQCHLEPGTKEHFLLSCSALNKTRLETFATVKPTTKEVFEDNSRLKEFVAHSGRRP